MKIRKRQENVAMSSEILCWSIIKWMPQLNNKIGTSVQNKGCSIAFMYEL